MMIKHREPRLATAVLAFKGPPPSLPQIRRTAVGFGGGAQRAEGVNGLQSVPVQLGKIGDVINRQTTLRESKAC